MTTKTIPPEIPGGYILLSRKLLESGILLKPPLYLAVWVYLLLGAQHEPHKDLKRGQVRISIPEIQEAFTYWAGFRKIIPAKTNIHRVLKWLRKPCSGGTRKDAMIGTVRGTNKMLITICNYEYYQNPDNYEDNNEWNETKPDQWDTMNKKKKKEEGRGGVNSYSLTNDCKEINCSKSSSKNLRDFDEKYLNIANTFLEHVKRTFPDYWRGLIKRYPSEAECYNRQMLTAVETIEKLIIIDGCTIEEVIAAARFAMEDDFWKVQFKSFTKLRKHKKNEPNYIYIWLELSKTTERKTYKAAREEFRQWQEENLGK